MRVSLFALAMIAERCTGLEMPSGEPRGWSSLDVGQWIAASGWEEYRGEFSDANLVGSQLLRMSDKQLRDQMLIVAPEHRRVILAEIAALAKAKRASADRQGSGWRPDEGTLEGLRASLFAGGKSESTPVRAGPERPMEDWSVSDVQTWLDEVGMTRAGPAFKRAKVDGRSLAQLDSEGAIAAAVHGIPDRGHRIALSQEVLALKACDSS